MLLSIQNTIQLFANLVVASAMGLSLAVGAAGAFHQHPLDLSHRLSSDTAAYADVHAKLVVAGLQ